MTIVRKVSGLFARILLVFVVVIVVYFFVAVILSAIPVKSKADKDSSVIIYLLSNGVHSDLVLPVRNHVKDWSVEIKFSHIPNRDTTYRYLAFGWGDRAFYLETPEWSDLKFKTAFNAVFGLGNSAMHATFFHGMREGNACVMLNLSTEQYKCLVKYIENTFRRDANGNVIQIIPLEIYGTNDAFYEASGRYNLFKTCNTWTNEGLKACGQKACLWTPFDKGIFWHYRK
ncbi:MAG TPA: TIGR02117 family protein [Bacteroidales bacterium]|nr:TIGR02117 family protein [Bacteroidales bacterium]